MNADRIMDAVKGLTEEQLCSLAAEIMNELMERTAENPAGEEYDLVATFDARRDRRENFDRIKTAFAQ